MRFAAVSYLFIFLTTQAFGATKSPIKEHWKFGAYYGLASINPGDINGLASSQGTTPKLNSLSTEYYYGGTLGYMVSTRFEVFAGFELQDANNGVRTTSPFSTSGAGFELLQNEIWGGLNYFIHRGNKTYAYVGASGGYPTYSHVTSTLSSKTEYDADKTVGYRGQIGAGVLLGEHFSFFAEGGYQYLVSGNIKNPSGTVLTKNGGGNAKMDLSGLRIQGGIAFLF